MIKMLQKDKLVRHKDSGLGQIQEYQSEKNEKGTLYVHFATHNLLVKESELTKTNVKIDTCYKYNGKTFFNLHDTENYVDKKEFGKEISELFYNGCPSISCNEVVKFILEQPDKLRTILNKYKHL